ncbi:MAG: DUF6807 family protein [bacterium]
MSKHIVGIVASVMSVFSYCRAESGVQWDTSVAHQLALRLNGAEVWRFRADPAAGTKPFFDPVCVAGGPSLTCARPPDHVWHYGLWFSWKFINGLNYWEESAGKSQGQTFWSAPKIETRADGSAVITCMLGYRPSATNEPVLSEQRTITVSAPEADGAYHMDWTQLFTAGGQPVTLDRTPLARQPNGQSSGGYAGLSVRYAQAFTNVESVSAASGRVPCDPGGRCYFTAAAAEQNGVISGKPYGIALLAHPANPRAPGDWYLIENPKQPFYYINAAFLVKSAFVIQPKDTLTLRYRVCVHPGRWDAEALRKAAARFAEG